MKVIPIILLALSTAASAQTVFQADSVQAQPQVMRDEKGYKSCGVRVVTSTLAPGPKFLSYDFSVNIWETASGMMKAGQYSFDVVKAKTTDLKNMTVIVPAPSSFWIGKRDDGETLKPTKYIPGNDAGFTLGGADGMLATKIILAIVAGEPMQVSLQYPKAQYNRVVSFQVDMSENDSKAVSSCMTGLIHRMQVEGPPKNK